MLGTSVAQPDDFWPDPDLTFENVRILIRIRNTVGNYRYIRVQVILLLSDLFRFWGRDVWIKIVQTKVSFGQVSYSEEFHSEKRAFGDRSFGERAFGDFGQCTSSILTTRNNCRSIKRTWKYLGKFGEKSKKGGLSIVEYFQTRFINRTSEYMNSLKCLEFN
jgi:hypothetical protein